MPKKIRVYELGRELGLTNKEALDLCIELGIGVKSHSSSIEDAQADRVRRKADRDGLRRPVQPEEPAPSAPAASRGRSAGARGQDAAPAREPSEQGPLAEVIDLPTSAPSPSPSAGEPAVATAAGRDAS